MIVKTSVMRCLIFFSISTFGLNSTEVLFQLPSGDLILDLERMETVQEIKVDLAKKLDCQPEKLTLFWEGYRMHPDVVVTIYEGQLFRVEYNLGETLENEALFLKSTHPGYRSYEVLPTESVKQDIRYILKALAEKSLTSLWGLKSKLEAAGNRIDHLHPLRFLEFIFKEDELKVHIYNIKKRGSWVWNEFIKGFKDTFQEEFDIGNLHEEFLQDFVKNIDIELSLVFECYQSKRWEEFVKTLIANVPRDGDAGRYDQ